MSAGKQPGTQIKLTNVSIVRLKKAGKRFEVNKIDFSFFFLFYDSLLTQFNLLDSML